MIMIIIVIIVIIIIIHGLIVVGPFGNRQDYVCMYVSNISSVESTER